MPIQSRRFRQTIIIAMILCLLGGSAMVVFQWARPPKRIEIKHRGGMATRTRIWSGPEKLWLRVGYIPLALGTILGIFLLATRNPYRYIESQAGPIMQFSPEPEENETDRA